MVAFVDKRDYNIFGINDKSTILTRDINTVREPFIKYNYMGWGFTHDYVLEWLKSQNVEEVILVGCADFENDRHYNTNEAFNPCQINVEQSIKYIESIKEYKVYTMNPNSKLGVERWELQ